MKRVFLRFFYLKLKLKKLIAIPREQRKSDKRTIKFTKKRLERQQQLGDKLECEALAQFYGRCNPEFIFLHKDIK